MGNLVRVDEPNTSGSLGAVTSPVQPTVYTYDILDNLKTVTQGVQTRTFVYDSLSRLKTATNPESGTITYTYDSNGNLLTKKDARNITISYVYDNFNRVKTRSYTDGTPTVSYYYDGKGISPFPAYAKGLLTKVSSSVSTTEFRTFDNLGRLLTHRQITDGNVYNTSYTYNLSGALIEETYPSGRKVKNTLDTDGDLSLVQTKTATGAYQNRASNFVYTAHGAASSIKLGNNRYESTNFNNRLQPTRIALGTYLNGTNLLKLDFNYGTTNNNGNVLSQTITTPAGGGSAGFTAVQTYTYDSLNRIKDAKEMIGATQTWKQTFNYDQYGNRTFDAPNTTTITNCPQTICNPTISVTNNRFNSGQGYTYDLSGNVISDAEGKTFIYDGENKQKEVKNSSNVTVGTYFYDGDGKRIKKVTASKTEVYVYDAGGKLVAEYSTLTPQTVPVTRYLTNDHLGSPRIITSATGAVLSRRDFMPFGEEVFIGVGNRAVGHGYSYGDSTRQKFTTYERDDETGLDFAQARMHNYNHGRFTSPDDFLNDTSANDPKSWNLYVYVRNNPLRFIDPSGEEIWISYRETVTRTDEDGNEITEIVTRQVKYTFGGLLNEDGSEYTGNNAYVLAAARNLDYMLQDRVLGSAISDLVRTKKKFTIMQDPNDSNRNGVDSRQKIGGGTTIYWSGQDVAVWANQTERSPSDIRPAYAVLAHELIGHAWMRFKGIERFGWARATEPRFRGHGYVPYSEIDAVNIENRAVMIEDPSCSTCRHSYGGWDIYEELDSDFLDKRGKPKKPPFLKLSPRMRSRKQ